MIIRVLTRFPAQHIPNCSGDRRTDDVCHLQLLQHHVGGRDWSGLYWRPTCGRLCSCTGTNLTLNLRNCYGNGFSFTRMDLTPAGADISSTCPAPCQVTTCSISMTTAQQVCKAGSCTQHIQTTL